MLPSDDLRQALQEAMKQIEVLCVNFGYKPVEDLRRLVSDVVKKASECQKTSILPRMNMFLNDTPYLILSSSYASLKEQFKQKYIQIVKNKVIPAIRKYFDTHPNTDLHIFEPVINIRIKPVTAFGSLALGETLQIIAADANNNWNSNALAFQIKNTITAWKQGRPIASNLTTNQVREMLTKENPENADFLVDGFPDSLAREIVERDLKTAFRRVQNVIKNTPYKAEGVWQNRTVKGQIFPLSFVMSITK